MAWQIGKSFGEMFCGFTRRSDVEAEAPVVQHQWRSSGNSFPCVLSPLGLGTVSKEKEKINPFYFSTIVNLSCSSFLRRIINPDILTFIYFSLVRSRLFAQNQLLLELLSF